MFPEGTDKYSILVDWQKSHICKDLGVAAVALSVTECPALPQVLPFHHRCLRVSSTRTWR